MGGDKSVIVRITKKGRIGKTSHPPTFLLPVLSLLINGREGENVRLGMTCVVFLYHSFILP